MTQDDMERRLLEAARDYNDPPEPPREEMWVAIRQGLQDAGSVRDDTGVTRLRPRRPAERASRWTSWAVGLAAAATLAVGFGLGRITGPPAGPAGAGEPMAADAAAGGASSLPVRLAAADHLGEAEALLTLFRTTDTQEDRAATAVWARDLLGTTRLLLDGRAGQDPELGRLLADLELVLVQIASAGSDPGGQELIEDGMEERQLLAKLRAVAVPTEMAL